MAHQNPKRLGFSKQMLLRVRKKICSLSSDVLDADNR